MVFRRRTKIFDDRGLKRSLAIPRTVDFDLGSELAFETHSNNVSQCIDWSLDAMERGQFFDAGEVGVPLEKAVGNKIHFSSDVFSTVQENNEFEVVVHKAKNSDVAVVMFHHWFADERYTALGKMLASRGITLVEATLPYHFGRSPSDRDFSEWMINPNIGMSLCSMRQGVLDGLKIVDWLQKSGCEQIFVSGICIGSWIAALVAAKDTRVVGSSLWVGGGSAADVLWTSKSSPMLKEKIEPHLTLEQLRSLWRLIDLNYYTSQLSKRPIQLILANYDEIIQRDVSERFIRSLKQDFIEPHVVRLNCGHASLALLPYSLRAALNLIGFVKKHSR